MKMRYLITLTAIILTPLIGTTELYAQPFCAITQITVSMGGSNEDPAINGDGSAIAFESDRNLTGTNADENREIFLYRAGTGITQITNSIGGSSFNPAINSAGTAIAFNSTSNDLTGTNADENDEIFLARCGIGINTPLVPTSIPTLSEWGLMLLALLFGFAVMHFRKIKPTA